MKKKLCSVLLCVAMVATLLAGCGDKADEADKGSSSKTGESSKSTDGGKQEDVELTLWSIATESDAFAPSYKSAIEDFEKAHPGVTIKHETFENESYKTKIKAAVAANELPDVFFTWAGGFSQDFVDSGKVLPLDKYYENYKDEISTAALGNDTYDGVLYGSALTTPVSIMWYNKKMFEDAGVQVPTTYDEFKTVCQTFVDKGITPIGTSVKDTWVLAMLHDGLTLKSAGHDNVTKALTGGGVKYTDDAFLKSATAIKDLVDMKAFIDGATGLSNDEASANFYQEKVAMYFTGSWMGGSIMTDAEHPENFAAAPIPVVDDANAKITDFMGGASDTLMVAASTKNPDMAATAAFELTRGISKYAYLSGAGIPAWKVDYDTKDVPELTQQVAEYAKNATSFTLWFDTLMDSESAGEYLSLLQQLFVGDLSPKEFVDGMDAQLSK